MANFRRGRGMFAVAVTSLLSLAGTWQAVEATVADGENEEGQPPLATLAGLVDGQIVRSGDDNAVDVCKLSPSMRDHWEVRRELQLGVWEVQERWFWKEAEWLKSNAGRPAFGAVFADVESKVPDHRDKIHIWFTGVQERAENEIMEAITGSDGSSPGAASVFSGKTDFQQVDIGNSRLESGGKYVKLDGYLQSSSADEALYHESIVHQVMVAHPNPKRVLIGGGGEGANLREILKYSSVEKVLMVDIDEKFVKMCQEHLGAYHVGSFDDPRVEVRFGDAREYIHSTAGPRWDVIILDFPDFSPEPNHKGFQLGQLYSHEFYSAVRDRLDPSGIMITQGGSFETAAVRRTLAHTFTHVGVSFNIMLTYPTQTWFIASDLVDIAELKGEEVDKRLRDRIGAEAAAELKWYGGAVHDRMFALGSEIAGSGFFDAHDCILVDRIDKLEAADEDEVVDFEDEATAIIASLVNGEIIRNGEDNAVDDCKLSATTREEVTGAIERVREKWFWNQAAWLKSDAGLPDLGAIFADVESKVPDHAETIHDWFGSDQGVAEGEILTAITGVEAPVFSGYTDFHFIEIGNSSLKSGGQYLMLDDYLQSSSADEALYHESLVHQAMVAHSNPKRVLIDGGFEGGSLREVLKYSSVEKVLVVDSDEDFMNICREHLVTYHVGSFDDPRVEVRFGDSREYIENRSAMEQWDVIILDFSDFIPTEYGYNFGELYTHEFYLAVRERLAPGGIMIAQGGTFEMAAVRRTLAHTFAHVGVSFNIMLTYPVQTWFLASDDVGFAALKGEEVDKRLHDRIGADAAAKLKWYGGEVHDRMFALGSEIADGGYFDRHDCILVDRVAGLDGDEDDAEVDTEDNSEEDDVAEVNTDEDEDDSEDDSEDEDDTEVDSEDNSGDEENDDSEVEEEQDDGKVGDEL